jgi:hypothetical protein
MIAQASGHGWSDPQRLVDSGEIAMKIQADALPKRGGLCGLRIPKGLSFRSAGLRRKESAVSLPAESRFLADKLASE